MEVHHVFVREHLVPERSDQVVEDSGVELDLDEFGKVPRRAEVVGEWLTAGHPGEECVLYFVEETKRKKLARRRVVARLEFFAGFKAWS